MQWYLLHKHIIGSSFIDWAPPTQIMQWSLLHTTGSSLSEPHPHRSCGVVCYIALQTYSKKWRIVSISTRCLFGQPTLHTWYCSAWQYSQIRQKIVQKTLQYSSSIHGARELYREAAAAISNSCPVHPDKPSTDRSYHRAIEHLLKEWSGEQRCRSDGSYTQPRHTKVCLGKDSLMNLDSHIHKGRVAFGQLLGMGDYLTL